MKEHDQIKTCEFAGWFSLAAFCCGIAFGRVVGGLVEQEHLKSMEAAIQKAADHDKTQVDELVKRNFNPLLFIGAYRARTNDLDILKSISQK